MIVLSVSLFKRRSNSVIGGGHKFTYVLLIVLRNKGLVVGKKTPCMQLFPFGQFFLKGS